MVVSSMDKNKAEIKTECDCKERTTTFEGLV